MSRYIDVEPLEKALKMNVNGFKHEESNYAKGFDVAIATMKGILQGLPTADVVEVVRCKDCKHRNSGRMSCQGRHPDWYCPKGERKEK